MRQLAVSTLALLLGMAAAFALAACGGEDAKLLPGATAAEISENLDSVKQLASEGECVGAADAADQVGAQVEALTDVDPELKQALERGAARLDEVVATCEEAETEVVPPTDQTEEKEEELPPGQAKKEEKEQEKEEKDREKEERELEKEEEKAETPVPPEKEPPPSEEAAPPSESGGTGAGGVGPATPAPGDE